MSGYTYIWEFEVRPGREAEFERHYGPEGTWVELFRSAPGYIDTVLLRDLSNPHRYVTVDRWKSRADYDAFRASRAQEFDALDGECERLTRIEHEVGRYEVVS